MQPQQQPQPIQNPAANTPAQPTMPMGTQPVASSPMQQPVTQPQAPAQQAQAPVQTPIQQAPVQQAQAPAAAQPAAPPTVAEIAAQQQQKQAAQLRQQKNPTNSTNPIRPSQNVRRNNPNSSQGTLLISELRDSMVVMKDGSFRSVVACKSINYDLMSDEERESVEYAYQEFLNSLDFPIQILVRSQRVDIAPYIERLTELRRQNDNMLLGVLMEDYIEFIDILSQEANIMDKSFFIIIPYYTSKDAEKALEQSKNFFKTFTKDKTPPVTRIDRNTYDKAVTEINNRVETVVSGLFQIGIQSVRLNTKELGQLYYNFNNPDTAVREPLGDFNKLAHLYVRKGERGEQED